MAEIYIIHENHEWTVHLTRELGLLGLPYQDWPLAGPADGCSTPNPHRVKFEVLPEFHSPLIAACAWFLAQAGIDVAGVEFIVDKSGKAFGYDINTNPNYNREAEQQAGVNAMNSLAGNLDKEPWLLDAGNRLEPSPRDRKQTAAA